MIEPGAESRPFVDFRARILELPEDQRVKVVGKANLQLIGSGAVRWEDVVTGQRVRDLREVAALKRLSVEDMVKAGVGRRAAEQAHESVHTPAHELARKTRQEMIDRLTAKGIQKEDLKRALGERLAARVGIGEEPSGPGRLPVVPTMPKVPPAPKGKGKRKPPVDLPVPTRADYLKKARVAPEIAGQAALLEEAERDLNVTFAANYHDRKLPFVVVDVAALDAALAEDRGFHVGPGGVGPSAKPGAYERFLEFLAKAREAGTPIEMPKLILDDEGRPSLADGRHRWAVFRDGGAAMLPVVVPRADFAAVRRRYGAAPREEP